MTKRQRQVLDFVEKFWEMHRYSPSYREVAENQEIAVSPAFYVVKTLAKQGLLHIDQASSRSIYPIKVWKDMRCETDLPETA